MRIFREKNIAGGRNGEGKGPEAGGAPVVILGLEEVDSAEA